MESEVPSLALTPNAGLNGPARLAPAGRYDSVKSRKFKDICLDASKGHKFNLDDEIEVLRGHLATLVSALAPDDDQLLTDSLFLRLTHATGENEKPAFTEREAREIVKRFDSFGKVKEFATLTKEVRETLAQAAEFDQMMPAARVKRFLAACFGVIRQEAKDEKLVARIARGIQLLHI